MPKVSRELAEKEISEWLDYKKISAKKREDNKDSVEKLIESVMDGFLSLDGNTFKLSQTLLFPFGEEVKIIEISYSPRLNVGRVKLHMENMKVKASDGDGRLIATICALTLLPSEIIKAMDTEDYSLAQNIGVFFL